MRVFIAGTGTDVGKTHVSACVLSHLARTGVVARAYKPVASGVDELCEDASRHAEALGAPYVPPTYAYRRPVSPHLAAREEGPAIDLGAIVARADALAQGAEVLVIESAGGLFSPLGPEHTNADLLRRLGPTRTLLVAPDRLGVLSDVRAYLLAARASGLVVDVVVLSAPPLADASTGSNGAELAALGITRVAAAFPRENVDAEGSRRAAADTLAALRAGSVAG